MLIRAYRYTGKSFFLLGCLWCIAIHVEAATVSWWRFEAGEDSDPSDSGLINPNEIASEPAIVSSNATIGTSAPDLFDTVVPQVNVANTGSVRSFVNGSGGDGIFGSAAYSSTLDVNSITVEFWMRTTESDAGFVARTIDSGLSGEQGTLLDGFRIVDPNNVRVEYYTDDGSGGGVRRQLDSNVDVRDGLWHYIAFTYDAATGVGNLYVDDVDAPAGTRTDAANRNLWWGAGGSQPGVHIGYRMDGNPNNNTGTLDEIRFTDSALPPEQLLIVPEASQIAAVVTMIFLFCVMRPTRRMQQTQQLQAGL